MVTKQQIELFLKQSPIAVAGASRNPKKFGHSAFKEVKEKGLNLIPVNPHADEILGVKSYPSVTALPDNVSALWIITPKAQTAGVVEEAIGKGIKNIWIQQMSETKEALSNPGLSGLNLISKECMLMHYKPHSIHKFHRSFKKFFGRLPK